MTETTFWSVEVEAKDTDEAEEIADSTPIGAWNSGDSEYEIDDVQQLTRECECGAVIEFDDLNEVWDCEECHTVFGK